MSVIDEVRELRCRLVDLRDFALSGETTLNEIRRRFIHDVATDALRALPEERKDYEWKPDAPKLEIPLCKCGGRVPEGREPEPFEELAEVVVKDGNLQLRKGKDFPEEREPEGEYAELAKSLRYFAKMCEHPAGYRLPAQDAPLLRRVADILALLSEERKESVIDLGGWAGGYEGTRAAPEEREPVAWLLQARRKAEPHEEEEEWQVEDCEYIDREWVEGWLKEVQPGEELRAIPLYRGVTDE